MMHWLVQPIPVWTVIVGTLIGRAIPALIHPLYRRWAARRWIRRWFADPANHARAATSRVVTIERKLTSEEADIFKIEWLSRYGR